MRRPDDFIPRSLWVRRRSLLWFTLLFCFGFIGYIILYGEDTSINETALLGLMSLLGSLVLGYFGFATMDDNNHMTHTRELKIERREHLERRSMYD